MLNIILAENVGFRTFALREYLISIVECVRTNFFKLMPGYSFVRLGALAGSYQRLFRADLFLSLPFFHNSNTARFMSTKKPTYSEKLLNPLWQKKRLSILDRDNWTCVLCNDNRSTLHVHHTKYKGNPWEIECSLLKTLCWHCHDATHALPQHEIIAIKKSVSFNMKCLELVCFTNKGVVFLYLFAKDNNKSEIIKVFTNKMAA